MTVIPIRTPADPELLAESQLSEQRVLAEAGVIPLSTSVQQLADIIAKDPLKVALRLLNLEFQVRNQHDRITRLEKLVAVGGSR